MISDEEKNYKHKEFTETGYNVTPDMVELIKEFDIPLHWLIGAPGIYAKKLTLTRVLAQYEIFKRIQNVPGSIVECGVFQGAGLLFYAKLLEIFCPGDRWKKVIGFDTFDGFVDIHEADKSKASEAADAKGAESDPSQPKYEQVFKGGYSSSGFYEILKRLVDIHHKDSFVANGERISLVQGDVSETIPQFKKEHGGERISLLVLDMDLYEPTLCALEHFYDMVTPGGIIVLDEYGHRRWPGESSAFDDFFGKDAPKLEKFGWSSTPGAFFVKS